MSQLSARRPAGVSEVTSPAPRADWQRLYEADPLAVVTQSPAWTAGACLTGGFRDASRLYRFDDGEELVLPLLAPTGPAAAVRSAGSMPASLGFGGVVSAQPIGPEVNRLLWDDLLAARMNRLRLRPNPLATDSWVRSAPPSVRVEPRIAHVLDLDGGFDAVWTDRFRSNVRNGVRKGERAGLDVVCSADDRQLSAFADLFALSVQRWAHDQNEPGWLAALRAGRRDPIEKFQNIAAACGDAFRLWVAWQDDEPVAAIIVLQGTNAHYTRGAMNRELAGPARANDLLQQRAIEDACRAGCRWYHMGETGASASLARFKERFGAVAVDYSELFAERLPFRSADQAVRTAVKRVIGFRDA